MEIPWGVLVMTAKWPDSAADDRSLVDIGILEPTVVVKYSKKHNICSL
jgi:hypothetical protein